MVTRRVVQSVILLVLPLMMSARLLASNSYTPRYHTIAQEILDIESGAFPVDDSMYKLLDDIIDDAKKSIGNKPLPSDKEGARRVLGTIDAILIKHNFIYPGKGCTIVFLRDALVPVTIEPNLLQDILNQPKNRRRKHVIDASQPIYEIDCDTTCFVYAAIGEALGLPISLVEVPRHNFIRWIFGDGSWINWEVNYGGAVGDDIYRRAYHVSQDLCERGVYLRAMSRQEVLGYCYALRSEEFSLRKNSSAAYQDSERATELYGRSFWGYYCLAWELATSSDPRIRNGRKAVVIAEKAAAIDPSAPVLDTLAAAYAESGGFHQAVKCEKEAHRLDPCEPSYTEMIGVYTEHKTYVQYQKEKAARGEAPDPDWRECQYRKARNQPQ